MRTRYKCGSHTDAPRGRAGGGCGFLREELQPPPVNFSVEHPWGVDAYTCGCGESFAFLFDVDVHSKIRVMSCPGCDCVHYQVRPEGGR